MPLAPTVPPATPGPFPSRLESGFTDPGRQGTRTDEKEKFRLRPVVPPVAVAKVGSISGVRRAEGRETVGGGGGRSGENGRGPTTGEKGTLSRTLSTPPSQGSRRLPPTRLSPRVGCPRSHLHGRRLGSQGLVPPSDVDLDAPPDPKGPSTPRLGTGDVGVRGFVPQRSQGPLTGRRRGSCGPLTEEVVAWETPVLRLGLWSL